MNKATIIKTIIDFIDAPYSGDAPEEFDDVREITLDDAERYLKDYLDDARKCDDEVSIKAFEQASPQIFLEAWSKMCVSARRRIATEKLSEFIRESEPVCAYDQYCEDYIDAPRHVYPVHFINGYETGDFPFTTSEKLEISDLIQIGINSAKEDFTKEFCWYDEEKKVIHTTNTPFADGVLDAEGFASFILDNADALGDFLDNIIPDEDIQEIFGASKEQIINGRATHYFVTLLHNVDDPWDETQEFVSEHDVVEAITNALKDDHVIVVECFKREVSLW